MKTRVQGETLHISDVQELGLSSSALLLREARTSLTPQQRNIDIDLSQTALLDSCGIGTLVALHKLVANRKGALRLLNPTPSAQQILELTRMHRFFQIVQR